MSARIRQSPLPLGISLCAATCLALALAASLRAETAEPEPSLEPTSGTIPSRTLTLDLGKGVGMDFVLIRAGSFQMGSERGEPEEKPVRKVLIATPFYLGKHEVTWRQWEAVRGKRPSAINGPDYPVDAVNWDDCQSFVRQLKERFPQKQFRLPTEAEWEYACRAGSAGEYCHGNDETGLSDYAWYRGNSGGKVHPVGQKKPNAWGLYDMHGNVWEWCENPYGEHHSGGPAEARIADSGKRLLFGPERVLRGGAWYTTAQGLRSACRNLASPVQNYGSYGFRVACSLSPMDSKQNTK